jgi:hypothetical protein
MRFEAARRILVRYCQDLDGSCPSTNKVKYPRPRLEGRRRDWWLLPEKGYREIPTTRSRAYLTAYREIEGSARIPGEGIRLDDGYLYLDKGVMKSALIHNLADFDEESGAFVLQA